MNQVDFTIRLKLIELPKKISSFFFELLLKWKHDETGFTVPFSYLIKLHSILTNGKNQFILFWLYLFWCLTDHFEMNVKILNWNFFLFFIFIFFSLNLAWDRSITKKHLSNDLSESIAVPCFRWYNFYISFQLGYGLKGLNIVRLRKFRAFFWRILISSEETFQWVYSSAYELKDIPQYME